MTKELDEYIKKCNLVFTNTIDRKDFCNADFDANKAVVNYDESISLMNLVSSFNKLYTLFKKEYKELVKLNLGKSVHFLNYIEPRRRRFELLNVA